MRISLIGIGRLKASAEKDLFDRYHERFCALVRPLGLERPKLADFAESPARRPEDRIAEEGRLLVGAIPAGSYVMALDERGATMTSADFAALVAREREAGRADMAFMIGGADGLHADARAHADKIISFGAMTIPHQLVRVLLMEQLYRAGTILTGHPYHRA